MTDIYQLVRDRAALLDLSEEGRIRVAGAGAEAALNSCFSMDLDIVLPWKGVTGLFLTDAASTVAIATVFKGDDEFFVFTEAATSEDLFRYLVEKLAPLDVEVVDLCRTHAWLCLIGPRAQAAMAHIGGEDMLGLPYLSFEHNARLEAAVFRMGFCGEFEYRILCPQEMREELKARCLDAPPEFGLAPGDISVLPLLMLEMRSLSKLDMAPGANPIDSGLHWMINFRKETVPGSRTLHASKSAPEMRPLMLCFDESGRAAAGDRLEIDGQDMGFCSCVRFSPTIGKDVGLAYVVPDFGWVGVPFTIVGKTSRVKAIGVSAPLFVTQTVRAA